MQEGLELQALVAECAGQVVGVAVVREAQELEYLRAHYDLERFLYFEHHRAYEQARLLHFALNPVFQHFTRHFLKVHLPTIRMRMMMMIMAFTAPGNASGDAASCVCCVQEVLRIGHKTALYYRIYPESSTPLEARRLSVHVLSVIPSLDHQKVDNIHVHAEY